MNALLKAGAGFNFGLPDAETFGEALMIFVVGIVTVFSVLAIILLILSAFQLFFSGKKDKKPEVAEPTPAPTPVAVPVKNDDEIIVAIAAAIAAAESESGAKFTVVSFKRK